MKKETGVTDIAQERKPVTLPQPREKIVAVIIGGNFQGLGVLTSLARQDVPIYLLDAEMCIGKFSRYVGRFSKCPDVKQEALFLEFLTDLARRENLEGWVVYPNDDRTVCLLAKNKELLEKYVPM